MLRDTWAPLRGSTDEACAPRAERVALLLGSSAPVRALASELGRIRAELGREPDPDEDREAAEAIHGWFAVRARA